MSDHEWLGNLGRDALVARIEELEAEIRELKTPLADWDKKLAEKNAALAKRNARIAELEALTEWPGDEKVRIALETHDGYHGQVLAAALRSKQEELEDYTAAAQKDFLALYRKCEAAEKALAAAQERIKILERK